mgnify:CR=1 FL=1
MGTLGFMVDCVNDVVIIDSSHIEPWNHSKNDHGCVRGIATIKGKTIVIIDAERMFCNGAMHQAVQEIAEAI